MGNVRSWASGVLVAALILLGPIIAFVMVVAAEILTDLVTKAGATAIWPVVAAAMAWVLLRKVQGQPHAPIEVRHSLTGLPLASSLRKPVWVGTCSGSAGWGSSSARVRRPKLTAQGLFPRRRLAA
jgi:hypothetical protein